jgi:integrase
LKKWSRVDLQQDRILLGAEHQKNGKPGSVPLNQTAHAVMVSRARFRAEYCPASPWVFCDRQGRRIASVKKGFASAVKRAGIAHVHRMTARRTCGSWLVQARVPIQEVARLLRHSDHRVQVHSLPGLAPV